MMRDEKEEKSILATDENFEKEETKKTAEENHQKTQEEFRLAGHIDIEKKSELLSGNDDKNDEKNNEPPMDNGEKEKLFDLPLNDDESIDETKSTKGNTIEGFPLGSDEINDLVNHANILKYGSIERLRDALAGGIVFALAAIIVQLSIIVVKFANGIDMITDAEGAFLLPSPIQGDLVLNVTGILLIVGLVVGYIVGFRFTNEKVIRQSISNWLNKYNQ